MRWGEAVAERETGSRPMVVDRRHGQETLTSSSAVHCGRSSKGWGVRVEWEKRGASGERERTDIS